MRTLFIASTLFAMIFVAACNPAATTENTATTNTNSSTTTNQSVSTTMPAGSVPPISSAHGSAPTGATGSTEKPEGVDTAALDAKIEKLEAKVKGGSATAADKKTLAETYFERGNIYYNAGSPRLYKFALGDLRRVLKYDATNTEAHEKVDELVRIYNSMGRPVPQNGLEP
ncbi:MAG: hypothetical protein ACJ74W_08610 [Pyrinomonadaceae bacterium]